MDTNKHSFEKADLILRHLRGELNTQEEEMLAQWLDEDEGNRSFVEKIKNEQLLKQELEFFSSLNTKKAWQKVVKQTVVPQKAIGLWQRQEIWKYAVAVILLITASIAIFWLAQQSKSTAVLAKKSEVLKNRDQPDSTNNIQPGGNKAKLTLADGSIIMLQDMANGTVREQNGFKIIKQDGQITYQYIAANNQSQATIAYNTISTPVGGQYNIILPDGSKVSLNSASVLRFPTSFVQERSVELKGEGYFEIAENKLLPFSVKTSKMTVQVLGTHFNVAAYPDGGSVNTTLLEGSVKVSNGASSKIMMPGQQARVAKDIQLIEVDVEEAIAWKNGLFQFNNEDLESIMRQLQRWYAVDVAYEGNVQSKHFTGIISRDTDIMQVLKMLELSGEIHFKVQGRKVTASPK